MWELLSIFHSWFWDFACVEPVQVLCMLTVSVSVYVLQFSCVCRHCFLEVTHPLPPRRIVFPSHLSYRSVRILESDLKTFSAKWFKVSHSVLIVQLCTSELMSIGFKQVLWWGLSSVVIYCYSNMSSRLLLLLCSFSRIMVGGLP